MTQYKYLRGSQDSREAVEFDRMRAMTRSRFLRRSAISSGVSFLP